MDYYIRKRLMPKFFRAIEKSVANVHNMQEPDYIAALVTNLPEKLSDILNDVIPNSKFRVGGCFIHQKPLASFLDSSLHKMKDPEIGDLLIVYKEIKPDGHFLYNALILQAKKAKNIYNTPISKNDYHQLILYSEWPRFQYKRAGILNGTVRSISPKTITPGAQYLLIDEEYDYPFSMPPCTFWCAMPSNTLIASTPLAQHLVDLLDFQTGKPFVPRKGNIDQWSKMIWDLLSITACAEFNRRKAGYVSSPRATGEMISMLTDTVDFNPYRSYRSYFRYDDINAFDENYVGLSLIMIERDNRGCCGEEEWYNRYYER